MLYYYLITFILMALSLVILVLNYEIKKTNYYIMIYMLLATLANGGYLFIALSENISEALLANKICYLGGCFVPLAALQLTCIICNYNVPTWIRSLFYSFSFIVYTMVLTTGVNDFYYAEVYLEKYYGVSVLRHSNGIGYRFFYILLYGYMIMEVLLLVYSIAKKRAVSYKNLWALMAFVTTNIGLFVLGRAIGSEIEIMPIAYVIDSWILIYMYRRGMAYNIEDNIANSFEKQETYGYVMFDRALNYLGCNNMAVKIFPALSGCRIDKKITKMPGVEIISDWLDNYLEEDNKVFTYKSEDRHYECHIEKLWYRKKVSGYMLELREDTDKWKYMKLLSEHNSQLENFSAELENKVNEQTLELITQQKRIKTLYVQTVLALSEAVDAKDRYTSGHSKRVAEYARMIAARMGKSKEEQEDIYYAGLLHDIGKIRIPDEIINKPGKLTDEEYDIIKIHPVAGYNILKGISDDGYISSSAKHHHERYDGKGYPSGLAGNDIPESARILGVAESYDAMASNRSYRKALPQEVVRSEIEKGKNTQFDPVVADIMLNMIDEDKEYKMRQTE